MRSIPLMSLSALTELYSKTPDQERINAIHNTGRRMPKRSRTYEIYTVNSLPRLIQSLSAKSQKVPESDGWSSDEDNTHTIRYLLTKENVLLFAEEGNEPAHFVMTGETKTSSNSFCHCAGNLTFSDDFSKFVSVNNKSGDFAPEDVLLKNVLAVLVALADNKDISLSESFNIQHQNTNSKYTVTQEILREFVYSTFSKEQLDAFRAVNCSAEHRTVQYEPKNKSRQRVRKKSRSIFSEQQLSFVGAQRRSPGPSFFHFEKMNTIEERSSAAASLKRRRTADDADFPPGKKRKMKHHDDTADAVVMLPTPTAP